jgi:hypothetical protein
MIGSVRIVGRREQLDAANATRRTRPTLALAARAREATVIQRRVHSPPIEPQRALWTIADTDGAELGGVLADPVAAHTEHRRHGGRVDVAQHERETEQSERSRHGGVEPERDARLGHEPHGISG